MSVQQSVIVLGLGIAGSSIAAELASQGFRVTAIEQFAPLHERGSSHGDTRIFRRVPHEGSVYVQMAAASLSGWRKWNEIAGEDLYLQTGGIDAGPEESPMVRSAETLCLDHEQPFTLLSGKTFTRQHPEFNLPANWRVVYQPTSGIVCPDATRTFLHRQARAAGATLLHNTAVLSIEPTSTSVRVRTATETYTADHLIVSAGSWLPKLLPELNLPFSTERRVLAWHRLTTPATKLPIFILDAGGGWYGMPTPSGRIKIGHDKHLRQQIDPNQPPTAPTEEDVTLLRGILPYLPTINPTPDELKTCIYTITPDHHFLIDHHPDYENILIFSCCSGHGFKYAPVYGQIAADLLLGHPRPDLASLKLHHTSAAVIRYSN